MDNENRITDSLNGGAKPSTFEFAKSLRRNVTMQEQIMWKELKENKLGVKFRQQHPYGKYILDFYSHQVKLAIEIDGDSHNQAYQKEYDKFRTSELNRCGIMELRFSNNMVEDNLSYVLSEIKKVIDMRLAASRTLNP